MQITVDIPEPYVVHHNAQLMAQKLNKIPIINDSLEEIEAEKKVK